MSSSIITLNVSGTKIQTYKSTLLKCEYFKGKLDRWDSTDLIDQDYTSFVHFLNFLRNDAYVIPKNCIENVVVLADYYGAKIDFTEQPISEPKTFFTKNYRSNGGNIGCRNYFDIFTLRDEHPETIESVVFKISGDTELYVSGFALQFDDKIFEFGKMFASYFKMSKERDIFVYTSTKTFNNIFNKLILKKFCNLRVEICVENIVNPSSYIRGDHKLEIFVSGWE